MKIIQRGSMKVVPGKMEETMELMKEWNAMVTGMGMDPQKMRGYRRLTGSGDSMNTLIFEYEWSGFTEMANFFEKVYLGQEFQKNMAKWSSVIENHEVELYTPMP